MVGVSKVRPQGSRWSTAISSHSPRSRQKVTGNAVTGACLRTAQNAVATEMQKAADPDAAVLHFGIGNSYVDCIYSRIKQVRSGNSTSNPSQLTCESGDIWRGGVARENWRTGTGVTVTLKLRGARELRTHDCGAA